MYKGMSELELISGRSEGVKPAYHTEQRGQQDAGANRGASFAAESYATAVGIASRLSATLGEGATFTSTST